MDWKFDEKAKNLGLRYFSDWITLIETLKERIP
jgi:hypothetical protein